MFLRANNITVEFKNGYKGINNVDFEIGNGIYGLLGENGAGKTTLMRVLTTIIRPSGGQISFGGIDYNENNYPKIKGKLGYLPQELNLYPNLTVFETLMYLGQLSDISKTDCEKKVMYYLERTGLIEQQNKKNRQLSGGMKRRVGLVQALLTEPELLVVDEPTTGLDPEERVRIRKLLVDFSKERTVLFSTHVVEDLAATTDKILVMKKGELLYSGKASKLILNSEGKVWNCYVTSDELASEIEKSYKVTAKQFVEGGVKFKVLSEIKPFAGAEIAEVTLEDAYININC